MNLYVFGRVCYEGQFVKGACSMATRVLETHIEVTEGIVGGKPRIVGRGITVQNIVIWHERLGKSADEISEEYDLSLAAVYAALSYYFDHRSEIDSQIDSDNAFVAALHEQTPSRLQAKLAAHNHG